MPLLIGTSGWQYREWRVGFYPQGVPQQRWLEHYAGRFATVEVNSAFYRLPAPGAVTRWSQETPADFVFAVKASRFLTHVKRLREPLQPVQRLMERMQPLGPKLGPILLQLPASLRADTGLLAEALAAFPRGVRVALEPRHASWHEERTWDVLAEHDAALCVADAPTRRFPAVQTASWGYLRFHEGRSAPWPSYGDRALATWARRILDLWGPGADVFAYFNNDQRGAAVRDARRFAGAARRAGLTPSRVLTAPETPVPAVEGHQRAGGGRGSRQ